MKAINPNEIKDNFIELIGKEWMLVSAGDKEKFNMMTASWGGVGVLWNRPVVFAFIRPERYTREFIDAKNEFTITFLGPEPIAFVALNPAGRLIKWPLRG